MERFVTWLKYDESLWAHVVRSVFFLGALLIGMFALVCGTLMTFLFVTAATNIYLGMIFAFIIGSAIFGVMTWLLDY